MKFCPKCESEKPIDSFVVRFCRFCIECENNYSEIELVHFGVKVCTCCGIEKQRSEFDHRRKGNRLELRPKCKNCLQSERKEKYWSDPEKYRERSREGARKQRTDPNLRPKYLERCRKKRESGTFGGLTWKEYMRQYNAKHRDRVRELHRTPSREWARRNAPYMMEKRLIENLSREVGIDRGNLLKMDASGEFIETKRAYLELYRLLKERKNGKD